MRLLLPTPLFSNLLFCAIVLCLASACKSDAKEQSTSLETKEQIAATPVDAAEQKRIVFFGNSLSAAYGLDNTQQGFVGRIAQRIDSLGLNYKVVNAGLSGETTGGGLGRINWILDDPVDIFVLELGGNDALRGIDPATAKGNLQAIIEQVKTAYPDAKILLAGMQAPKNLGNTYTDQFAAIYPALAAENDIALIPFLLENVAAQSDLNLADGIHPNVAGHQIVAENVWNVLENLL
ncbi:MAG: arylesterase [Bacteroidota bacterium]